MRIIKFLILMGLHLGFISHIVGQVVPCNPVVNVTIIPLTPQTGFTYFYGVKVTLNQTYDQNVTVSGYIYDHGDDNANNPFEVTVFEGNTTSETSKFYETTPTATVMTDIHTIDPVFVSKNDIYFSTTEECVSFNSSFLGYAQSYLTGMYDALNFLDTKISLNENDIFDFLLYLNENGVSATANQFSLISSDVSEFESRLRDSERYIDDMAISLYGAIDTLSISSSAT